MEGFTEQLKKMLDLMGFSEARVAVDAEHHKISLFLDADMSQAQTAALLGAFDHLINLMLRKGGLPGHIIDLNYYRKERERLILELARAAAHKATLTKNEVELPPMNAYERRLVHMELTTHPELKTESVGIGKERRIIIKQV